MNSIDYKKLVKIYHDAYKILKDSGFTSEILFWIHQSSQDIRRLNKILKGKRDLSLGVKNKLQATIGLIKSKNWKFKKLQKKGTGINEALDGREDRIRWED